MERKIPLGGFNGGSFRNDVHLPQNINVPDIESNGIDHFYYTANVSHTGSTPVICRFEETRTVPIIPGVASDWYVSVESISIPGNGIPLFYFVGTGAYSATVSYSGTSAQSFLVYNGDIKTPLNEGQYDSQPVFTFQNMLNMTNLAIAQSFSGMKAAIPSMTGSIPPRFTFDATTQLFSIIAETGVWFPENPSGPSLFLNFELFEFFSSFQSYFYGFSTTQGQDALIVFNDNFNNLYTYNGVTYRKMTEEYSNQYHWSSFNTIVMTSNMPITPEFIGTSNSNGTNSLRNTIFSYTPPNKSAADFRNQIFYDSNGESQLVNLISNTPLNKIDFTLHAQDKNGQLTYIFCENQDSASVKFKFTRKTFYQVPATEIAQKMLILELSKKG
jgi:hypothetical protein